MRRTGRGGFTLVELLVVLAVVAILVAITVPVAAEALRMARSAVSMSNLRQLTQANLNYAADHKGSFVPAANRFNNKRWHGARRSGTGGVSDPFIAEKGYLAPYLGESGKVKDCPVLMNMDERVDASAGTFELSTGCGGFGYNMAYLGGEVVNVGDEDGNGIDDDLENPQGVPEYTGVMPDPWKLHQLPNAARVVMFTSSAFVQRTGGRGKYAYKVMEYPFTDPLVARDPEASSATQVSQRTVHFRHGGKAHVAWCDGRVTAELPNWGAESEEERKLNVGWFGPRENNGWLNPNYPEW